MHATGGGLLPAATHTRCSGAYSAACHTHTLHSTIPHTAWEVCRWAGVFLTVLGLLHCLLFLLLEPRFYTSFSGGDLDYARKVPLCHRLSLPNITSYLPPSCNSSTCLHNTHALRYVPAPLIPHMEFYG